jgi:hypothetical protein
MWRFYLENDKVVDIDSDHTGTEIANELQEQPGGGYVCDDDKVIPVRRVIYARRVTREETTHERLQEQQMRALGGDNPQGAWGSVPWPPR